MPPVCSHRAPSSPKIFSQSISPFFSCETAVLPRSEQPSAARTPNPRSVKFIPLRTVRPTPSYFDPFHVRLIDAALIDQILNQAADRIVGKSRHDRRVETETSFQSASDIVFAAAFPHLERPRRVYPLIARIEPEHHFAEGNDVPFTFVFWFDL